MSEINTLADYPLFWEKREYEHNSEVVALQNFLNKIPQINRLIDVGAGYGRLAPFYLYRARRSVLVDQSAKLLKLAQKKIKVMDSKRSSHLIYINKELSKVHKSVKNGTFDVAICIRFIHLKKTPDKTLMRINKLLRVNGYLVLEFPNKLHGKERARKIVKRQSQVQFANSFTLEEIKNSLEKNGFQIIEKRSVSNIRSSFLKAQLPISILIFLEEILQIPLSNFNFGPSIFILAKKRG